MSMQVPRDKSLDSTFALMREGYLFIKNRVERYQSDVFRTRLLLTDMICISGEEAARLFYDRALFQRHGAVLKRVQDTLMGVDAIQTMDGEAHLHRKQLFMSLMSPPRQQRLTQLCQEEWQSSLGRWQGAERVVLLDEATRVLCRAACRWAGIPVREAEANERAKDFISMVEAFGAVGPRHWRGRRARVRTELWIRQIIEDVRSGKLRVDEESALHAIAFYRQPDGNPMTTQMAAEELINVVRPTVAVAIFITFAALALHEYPEYRSELQSGDEPYLELFAQEVRRYYPFAPFLGAKVRKDFVWQRCDFKKGTLVLLDVYGTNHDSRLWEYPNEFRPERFKDWKDGAFSFIPQGGGDPAEGHRCPGEGITVHAIEASVDFLVNEVDFDVPAQDLSYSLMSMPTLPKSGFMMSNVRQRQRRQAIESDAAVGGRAAVSGKSAPRT